MRQILLALFLLLFSLSTWSQIPWNDGHTDSDKVENQLKIYPNPCKINKVNIHFPSKEISEIRLVNITGKEVLRKKYDFPVYKTHVLLNNIPNGIYLMQIKSPDNKLVVKKLMISKP